VDNWNDFSQESTDRISCRLHSKGRSEIKSLLSVVYAGLTQAKIEIINPWGLNTQLPPPQKYVPFDMSRWCI